MRSGREIKLGDKLLASFREKYDREEYLAKVVQIDEGYIFTLERFNKNGESIKTTNTRKTLENLNKYLTK